MTKAILSLILASMLVVSALGATASTASPTTGTFNQTALTKIFDSTNSTAGTTYTQVDTAIAGSTSGIYPPSIVFGAGTTNDTIYCWGLKYASNALTGIVKRTINATTAALGTDTTEQSITTADASISITSVTLRADPVVATGGGYLGFSGVSTTSTKDYLYIYIASGSSQASYKVDTSAAATAASSTAGNYYSFAVNGIWYEDAYFYVLYEGITVAVDSSGTITGSTTTGLYLQAVGASAGTLLYTSGSTSLAGTLSITGGTTGYITNSMAVGGNSNYTASALVLVVYKDTTTKAVYVTRSTGVVATAAATIATDTSGTTVYAPAGVYGSNYTYGIATAVGTSTTAYTNITGYPNASTTAGGSNLYYTAITTTAAPMVTGYRYSSGYATIVKYLSATSTYTYQLYISYANATLNTTAITTQPATIGTFQGPTSSFVDVNGALWFGYATYETTSIYPMTGYVGKVLAQVNQNFATSTTSGSILAVFSALMSFVIISLFMF